MNTHSFIPLYIDLTDFNVLIIGGGKVGTKRALNFLDHGAKVSVVSLNFSEELLKYKDKIKLVKRDAKDLDSDFISSFNIIITATNNNDLNSYICNLAKRFGKLCNNPTNPIDSNFIVPIFYSDDNLSIAITTFGKSSLTSKYILELIRENILSNEIYTLIETMGEVKDLLKGQIKDPSTRFTYYSKIFNDEIFRNYIKEGKLDLAIDRARVIMNG